MTNTLAHNDNGPWEYWTGEPRHQTGMGDELFQLPRNAGDSYPHQKLATFGLRIVGRDDVPDGKQVVSVTLADKDGGPWEYLELEDIPEPEPEPYPLYRSAFIARQSNEEAGILEAALQQAEPKLRQMFYAVEYFMSDDPLFAVLHWTVTVALSEARADELLEPEE